ncbi:MAG TPA: hypothetical protein PLS95_14915 [Thermoanaerobaculales bacterium]|nr:hypothetical protein [Thermoanaerobaculales bacterium]HQN97249.1 hypothetical protein [Thermoanaerobaculales bacterium]HQP42851.1 hypothetical protein [Thermoanaerobaculales bacterium]
MPQARKLLQVHLEADLYDQLERWQEEHGFKTTTGAVRALLVAGMAAEPTKKGRKRDAVGKEPRP